MAEEKKEKKVEKKVEKKEAEQPKKGRPQEERSEMLLRIHGYDIPGSRKLLVGLTYIKGISWALSNVVCLRLGLDKDKKISDLTKADIQKIEEFIVKMPVPDYMKNRRHDLETGESKHYLGTDLEMKKEFDIKRMREMKSYKGIRHGAKLPVRGQRTRSHFRIKSAASTMKMRKKTA